MAANASPDNRTRGLDLSVSQEMAPIRCCCGSLECVFLKHNCAVLDSVERDVNAAARAGQVC